MPDLTTLAELKDWLGIKALSTDDDALLTRIMKAASGWMQQWLNRQILSAAYTEVRDGVGGQKLFLANYPVTALSSLIIDTVTIPAAANALASGYIRSDRMIYLRGYCFNRGFQNVSIAYTAGFATVPPELAQVCIELASLRYRERDRIGQTSKQIAGETISFMTKDLTDNMKTIMNNYKKVVLL